MQAVPQVQLDSDWQAQPLALVAPPGRTEQLEQTALEPSALPELKAQRECSALFGPAPCGRSWSPELAPRVQVASAPRDSGPLPPDRRQPQRLISSWGLGG